MTDYCVGCDNIVGGEKGIIDKVARVLESKNNNCERLNVGPNYVQSKGLSNSSKGKIAVFIVGGSDVGTYVDFMAGLKRGYYHYKYIWFAFCSWTAHSWITPEDLKNKGLVRAHDDNFSKQSDIAPWLGKSADYFFKQNKQYMDYVYGQSPEELANKILNGGGESSDSEGGGSSASTIKEALKQVLAGWDGDVECYIRDDTVYVNKIPDPTSAKLILAEGRDIIYDSVKVTDVNPTTINDLTVLWNSTSFHFRDEELVKRFGEVKGEVTLEDESIKNNSDARSMANTEWAKIKRDNGHSVECKVIGNTSLKAGQWVRMYIPSFNIDDYLYLSKISHNDNNGDWVANITLVDYPPGFGEPQQQQEEDDKEDETSTTDDTVIDETGDST